MNRFSQWGLIFSVLLLVACSNDDPPTDAPQNVTVIEGEGLVAVNWDVVAGRTYWIFFRQGDTVSLSDTGSILFNKTSPYLVTGLENGTQYAFAMTSSIGSSAVGPLSPVLTVTPRLLSPAIPWFEGTSLSTNNLHGIALGGSYYVTVGDAATLFIGEYSYIEDIGVTSWEPPATLPVSAGTNLVSVIFDGVRFMALGDDGSVIKNSDTDVQTWEAATSITGAPMMNALTAASGIYVAVGDAGAIYTNTNNGATGSWIKQTSGTGNNLNSVAFVNGQFIAVGDNGTLLTSSDGTNWVAQNSKTSNTLHHVAYGAENYVAVGDAGTIISSANTTRWTVQVIPTTESFRSITFGFDGQFVAVGTAGVLAYSTTGEDGSWATSNAGTIDLNSIVPNQLFIAVGDAGANVVGK